MSGYGQVTAITPSSTLSVSQVLGQPMCVSVLNLRGTVLLLTPFCHNRSSSERPCDTPRDTQLACGRARVQTQAERGVISEHPPKSEAGCPGGDGKGVTFTLVAALGLAVQVHHVSVDLSIEGATGVRTASGEKLLVLKRWARSTGCP